MRKYILINVFLFLGGLSAFAQQDPGFSLYKFNMNMINPAYAGANGSEVNFNFKTAGIEDGPEAQGGSASLDLGGNFGLGVSVVNDQVFVKGETMATLDASYKVQLSDQTNLFFGVKAGANFVSVDFSDIIINDPNDPLFGASESITNPVFGAGVLLQGKSYFLHFSIPNFIGGDQYQLEGDTDVSVEGQSQMATYIGAGADLNLGTNLVFKPAVYTRFQNETSTVDLIGGFDIYKLVEAGVIYRLDERVTGYALIHVKDILDIGYGYNASQGDFQNYDDGSHEVVLKIKF
ncbi:MAG: PorP/SprF family type IX secretion system membrane protein [Flavobacteriaceae bacterium]